MALVGLDRDGDGAGCSGMSIALTSADTTGSFGGDGTSNEVVVGVRSVENG
jgi:hypothetical protein